MKSSKKLRLYVERNLFYSNYLRCQLLAKHLPYEVTFYDLNNFNPEGQDIVLFQTPLTNDEFIEGIKYVWDLDDVLETKEVQKDPEAIIQMMKRCFSYCDGVIFGSQGLCDHYKDWYSGKYMIQDDYIDPCDHTQENQKHKGKVRVGLMGSNCYKPEVLELLPIMDKLRDKIDFIVIGVNSAISEIRRAGFIYIPFNPNYEEFQYFFTNQALDIGIIYQKHRDIMLAKNYLKWAEFAWIGVPVVASNWITGKYVPKELFVPIDNIKEVSGAICGLLDASKRKLLGKKAQKFAKDNFSLHNFVNKYIKFLEDL